MAFKNNLCKCSFRTYYNLLMIADSNIISYQFMFMIRINIIFLLIYCNILFCVTIFIQSRVFKFIVKQSVILFKLGFRHLDNFYWGLQLDSRIRIRLQFEGKYVLLPWLKYH